MANRIISLVRMNYTVHCTATSMLRGGSENSNRSSSSLLQLVFIHYCKTKALICYYLSFMLVFEHLIGPFYAAPNLTPALFTPAFITPGKKFGLLPLWTTFNAIKKCKILKIDKGIIYSLLVT